MQTALSTSVLLPRPLDPSHLAAVRAAGFSSIEIYCDRAHFPYHDAAAVAGWKQQFQAAGIEILSLQLPRHPGVLDPDATRREEAMIEIELAIDAAEALGARLVVLSMGCENDPEVDGMQIWLEDAIARLSGYASPRGLELACENMNSAMTRVTRLATSIENVGRSMVGICIDLGAASNEGNIAEAIRAAGREFYHLQICDRRPGDGARLPVGQGALPWPEIFVNLRESGFSGFAVLEFTDPAGGAGGIEPALDAAKASAARLAEC